MSVGLQLLAREIPLSTIEGVLGRGSVCSGTPAKLGSQAGQPPKPGSGLVVESKVDTVPGVRLGALHSRGNNCRYNAIP